MGKGRILGWSVLVAILLMAQPGLVGAEEVAEPEDLDYRGAFLPGLAYRVYKPLEDDRLYHAISFHYALVQGVTSRGDLSEFGGYYEWFIDIGFYKEQDSAFNDDIFFDATMGVHLSFEKFISQSRNFMIPYFGVKVGTLVFNNKDQSLLLQPDLGMIILRSDGMTLGYDAGLFLSTEYLADMIGINHSLTLNLNL